MCHNNEEWHKKWRGIDLSVQKWHGEFNRFWPKHSKISKNLHFNGLLLTKVYSVWAKKEYRGVTFMTLNTGTKLEGKMACAFKNDIRNWANFHQSKFGKSKNWNFDGVLLSKAENACA